MRIEARVQTHRRFDIELGTDCLEERHFRFDATIHADDEAVLKMLGGLAEHRRRQTGRLSGRVIFEKDAPPAGGAFVLAIETQGGHTFGFASTDQDVGQPLRRDQLPGHRDLVLGIDLGSLGCLQFVGGFDLFEAESHVCSPVTF